VTRRLVKSMRLLVASHNPGKLLEIQELLAPFGIEAVSASKLGLAEPVETGTMFASNARLKSRAAVKVSGLPALGDDSGLCVDALDGAPGIFSARWAGPNRDFASAMARVECELKKRGADSFRLRRAHFVCALCLSWPDGEDAIFEGRVFGTLVWPPRGGHGFGYDPMFLADGETLTFGEMASDRKHAISHRARAFKLFIGACLSAN
jgi:XTP/dITP diphosphohydrolase